MAESSLLFLLTPRTAPCWSHRQEWAALGPASPSLRIKVPCHAAAQRLRRPGNPGLEDPAGPEGHAGSQQLQGEGAERLLRERPPARPLPSPPEGLWALTPPRLLSRPCFPAAPGGSFLPTMAWLSHGSVGPTLHPFLLTIHSANVNHLYPAREQGQGLPSVPARGRTPGIQQVPNQC